MCADNCIIILKNTVADILNFYAPAMPEVPTSDADTVNMIPFFCILGLGVIVYVIYKLYSNNASKNTGRVKRNGGNLNILRDIEKKANRSSNSNIEQIVKETMSDTIKFDFDKIREHEIDKTIELMKKELRKSLEKYRDDDTYMLPEDKAKQILEELISIAVSQRTAMVEEFIGNSETGSVFSFFNQMVDEINACEIDARTKFREMRYAQRKYAIEADILKEEKGNAGLKNKNVSADKDSVEESLKSEQQDDEDFAKDVQNSQSSTEAN